MNELFLKTISLKNDIDFKAFDNFPLNICALRFFERLNIKSPVLILNGENGCGKSTLIEAIASLLDLPTSGGNKNMGAFVNSRILYNEEAPLSKYLLLGKSFKRPKTSYFFRAESFYELAKGIERDSRVEDPRDAFLRTSNYTDRGLLNESHGESFMDLIEHQFQEYGLFILDEPESALSPENQFKLLYLIDKLAKEGSQFIIATHSPILLSYRDAQLINLDDGMKEIKFTDTKIYKMYSAFMKDPDKYQMLLFDEEFDPALFTKVD